MLRKTARISLVGATAVVIGATVLPSTASAADAISFGEQGQSATFGANAIVRIDGSITYDSNCPESGIDDFFYPATDVYIVPTGGGSGELQDAGGGPWMLVTGDLDRDGREDVATVNGRSNTAAVLRGDGRGGLEAPRVYPIAPFGLASDLGDMDGDGDLDWLTSSYSGEWRLLENRGDGVFEERALFRAPRAASCALPFDADADGDLDLALIDEEADEVIVLRNGG